MKKTIILLLLIIFLTGCSDCPKGYEQYGDICKKEIERVDALVNLNCEDGYKLLNDKCVNKDTKDPIKDYVCPQGYELKDSICIKYVQIEIK